MTQEPFHVRDCVGRQSSTEGDPPATLAYECAAHGRCGLHALTSLLISDVRINRLRRRITSSSTKVTSSPH